MENIKKERLSILKQVNSPDSIYSNSIISFVLVAVFVVIDAICSYSVWNTVATENPAIIIAYAVACGICLDVPLSIGAQALKAYHQKMMKKKPAMIILILSIVTFGITFALYLGFKITTKDLSFDTASSSNLVNTLEESSTSTETSPVVWFAGLFSGIIPLCTSIASFILSYYSFDPLGIRIIKYRKAEIANQALVAENTHALAEAESEIDFCISRVAYERDRFNSHNSMIDAEEAYLKQLAAEAERNKLGTPDDITVIKDHAETVNTKVDTSFDAELLKVFENICNPSDSSEIHNTTNFYC